ncbi:EmrB/QacA subfamily drug resistance transporter [Actinocorallia herbida]|uniref:EmrB/QacA subfamily drug resistance transporter n=1 Tax=Actinocorallia herbida TaxID=58109 RepID=A0A3N1DCQ0_9ACTN|nr:MFS transporter [Actinocorallia herbida]ROO91291.1 EmrB/QacA subfamily drug resistance transporter [Actinocorallia herbida]
MGGQTGEASRGGVWVVIGALMLGMLLGALDQTIVSTALPTIVSEFGGLNHLAWVVTAYLLASTASTPLWGKLGDQYGRKRLYISAIIIFLVGSVLCGAAWNMLSLIVFRAFQGLGGGGLIVLGMAIVGDVVPPRERGRYQGFFGGVFGVASVAGPLLGGFFVDNLTWRWVFYVNVPIGVVALVLVSVVLHGKKNGTRHRIDYAGTAAIAGAAVCLVLGTTWGGTEYPWNSPVIIGLFAAAVVLIVVWWSVERRAAEPVLPLHLFRNPVFSVGGFLAFVIGFALFGSVTYFAVYLQVVKGESPTMSGLSLLPQMAGVLVASITSGLLITRTGHYRPFPIIGTGLMTVALALCSRLSPETSVLEQSLYFATLGVGLGCVMQVLIIAVQNSSPYEDLGAATSGNTFLRSIGGSFGVAVFGTIFSNQLATNVAQALRGITLPPGVDPAQVQENSAVLRRLPAPQAEAILGAYSDSIQTVFLCAVPVAATAFIASWFLREVPLKTATREAGMGESMGAPSARSSRAELELCLARLLRRDPEARVLYAQLAARSGLDLPAGSIWALCRIAQAGSITGRELAGNADTTRSHGRHYVDELVAEGLVDREGEVLAITNTGRAYAERVWETRRRGLDDLLEGWDPDRHPELTELLDRMSKESLGTSGDLAELSRERSGLPR